MFDAKQQKLDLHFVNFKYRKNYIRRVLGYFEDMQFELALNARQQAIECFYPSLIDSSRFNQTDRSLKKETRTLRASKLGVARLDFSAVDTILQVGENIEFEQPMYVIVVGKAATAE